MVPGIGLEEEGLAMSQINELLAKACGQIGALPKTERNREQGFMFRSIDAITAAAKPVFAELGISVTPKVLEKAYEQVQAKSGARGYRCTVTMEYTFGAPDGSERVTSMGGEAIDYGDKSTTKAEQMAYKYALIQVLLIGSGDSDPDAESHDLAESSLVRSPSPWQWVWTESKILKAWTDDERLQAAKTAMENLALGEPTNMDEARAILEHMRGQYETRGLQDDALPLEEK